MELREVLKALDILDAHDRVIDIEYRTTHPLDTFDDMLAGLCHYENGELISDDGDDYSLDDEIYAYEFWQDTLVVWYESEWISG